MLNAKGMRNGDLLCDGEFEIVRLTHEYHDEAVELFKKHFMVHENLSIVTDFLGSQQSTDEMEIFVRAVLSDGVSFGAKHISTNQLVAIACNHILNPSTNCTLDSIFEKCKSPKMLHFIEFMDSMKNTYDLYREWNIDCLFEIVFMSTNADFGRKGLAIALAQHSIEYARKLMLGTLPLIELSKLPTHTRNAKPKAVCSIFTSLFTQRVGQKFGLKVVHKLPYADAMYEGVSYAERIDPIHQCSTFQALRL